MCLIVDANLVGVVFGQTKPDYAGVYKAIVSGAAKMVYGGKLTNEYRKVVWFRSILLELDRQGRTRQYPSHIIEARVRALAARGICRSDDPHVLGLAQVSGARILCSEDSRLCSDFLDVRIVSNPQGNVYKRPKHNHLFRKHCRDA